MPHEVATRGMVIPRLYLNKVKIIENIPQSMPSIHLAPTFWNMAYIYGQGAKGDWDLRISDLVKNPDGTDI